MNIKENLKGNLKELFPELTEPQLEFLVGTSDDINVLITRVLDKNIEPPKFELRELVRTSYAQPQIKHTYNYPEVFARNCMINMHQDIEFLRKQASLAQAEAIQLVKQAVGHPIKETRGHFSIEAEKKKQIAQSFRREAAIVSMRKIVENNTEVIDMHGFTVQEALQFMDDLLHFKRFTEIQVITGQKYNSSKLRPALEEWFNKKQFIWIDAGPSLKAKKKAVVFMNTGTVSKRNAF